MAEARKTVCTKYRSSEKTIGQTEEAVLGFFEDPGLYLKKRIFDIEMLWELYSYYAEYYWPILEPRVRELRAERKDNTWYSNFENLCKETIAYSKKQRAPYSDKTDQELRRFVASEIEL